MSKFQIGEKVRIKSYDYLRKHREESPICNGEMMKFADTIQEVDRYHGSHKNWVLLKDVYNDNYDWQWRWHENWLEPVAEVEINTNAIMNLLNI